MKHLAVMLCLPLGALVVISGGCATRRSVDDLERKIGRVQQENFELRKELTEARVRLQMRQEQGPARSANPAPAAPAPVAREIPDTASAVPPVVYSEPITDAASYAAGSVLPGSGASVGQGAPHAGATGPTPASLMDAGKASLDARHPESALMSFREVVAGSPGDALADDAQFGIGECYFQMGRYEEAIAEYRKVIDQFPFGDQVPYAFLKIGFSRLALEQRDQALDSFRTVSEAYPGTEAATVARQQIAHLKAAR